MREIKFRGKRVDNGEWVYGMLFDGEETTSIVQHILKQTTTNVYRGVGHEVDPETVGQYSGLKDKNGREIYERDVAKSKYGDIGAVKFHPSWGAFYYSLLTGKDEDGNIVKMIGSHSFYNQSKEYEVIGNIDDNPELLEAV